MILLCLVALLSENKVASASGKVVFAYLKSRRRGRTLEMSSSETWKMSMVSSTIQTCVQKLLVLSARIRWHLSASLAAIFSIQLDSMVRAKSRESRHALLIKYSLVLRPEEKVSFHRALQNLVCGRKAGSSIEKTSIVKSITDVSRQKKASSALGWESKAH